MFENPLWILILTCLCWPGIIPCTAIFFIARKYDFRNPFLPRRRGNNGENDI